jgi:hypothetical protein
MRFDVLSSWRVAEVERCSCINMVFANGFLFSVRELGFWTNIGHWVRVLDVTGSYMYIVL